MGLTLYLIIRALTIDKLKVNKDYFPNDQAKIAYIFGRTSRDA